MDPSTIPSPLAVRECSPLARLHARACIETLQLCYEYVRKRRCNGILAVCIVSPLPGVRNILSNFWGLAVYDLCTEKSGLVLVVRPPLAHSVVQHLGHEPSNLNAPDCASKDDPAAQTVLSTLSVFCSVRVSATDFVVCRSMNSACGRRWYSRFGFYAALVE